MRTRMMLIAALAVVACGDDDDDDSKPTPMDASTPFDASTITPVEASVSDASIDASPPPVTTPSDCALNPRTYLEIINACTDAEKVDKKPVLPLIGADGKLPPLP